MPPRKNYAARLSEYDHKGRMGQQEAADPQSTINQGIEQLAEWLQTSKKVVLHTGAGISTAAGIPDFRGPNGVWTREARGESIGEENDASFECAMPSYSHMAISALHSAGLVSYVVTQNVDALHRRSGIDRRYISELHGNLFIEKCEGCSKEYLRDFDIGTVGFRITGRKCDFCLGKLRDWALDWEDSLPESDLKKATKESEDADISIALGTSLQMKPSDGLPLLCKKKGGKFVIVNLQTTNKDKKADLLIHANIDYVFFYLCQKLRITVQPSRRYITLQLSVEWNRFGKYTAHLSGPDKLRCPFIQKVTFSVIEPDEVHSLTEETIETAPFRLMKGLSCKYGRQDAENKHIRLSIVALLHPTSTVDRWTAAIDCPLFKEKKQEYEVLVYEKSWSDFVPSVSNPSETEKTTPVATPIGMKGTKKRKTASGGLG